MGGSEWPLVAGPEDIRPGGGVVAPLGSKELLQSSTAEVSSGCESVGETRGEGVRGLVIPTARLNDSTATSPSATSPAPGILS